MAMGAAVGGDVLEGGPVGGKQHDLGPRWEVLEDLIEAQDGKRAGKAARVDGKGLQRNGLGVAVVRDCSAQLGD